MSNSNLETKYKKESLIFNADPSTTKLYINQQNQLKVQPVKKHLPQINQTNNTQTEVPSKNYF